jgi:hypothetical protein
MAPKVDHPTTNKAREPKGETNCSVLWKLKYGIIVIGVVMATNFFAPHESLQPVNQYDQDAQFLKVPVTPEVQHEISPQHDTYPEKKIFGLRLATFWLSLVLCIVV